MNDLSLEDQLKSYQFIQFDWKKFEDDPDSNYDKVAESENLGGGLFGMRNYLSILKNKEDGEFFVCFSADHDHKYLLSLTSREDLEDACDLYFDKMPKMKGNGLNMIASNMALQRNIRYAMPFKHPNNLKLFCGLNRCISGIENATTFNKYISFAPLRQATAFWNEETVPMYSIFRTLYSGSQFIFSLFTNIVVEIDGQQVHPLILTINYKKNNREAPENKYSKDLPVDCLAALDNYDFMIRNRQEVVEIEKEDEELGKVLIELMD